MNTGQTDDRTIPAAANASKIVVFLGFMAVAFVTADWAAGAALAAAGDLSAALTAILAVAVTSLVIVLATANAAVMLGMAVLAHEAVHRMLFQSRTLNTFWGGLLSALALIPFHANRQFHLTHHAYAHEPEHDPENAMHNRPFWHAFFIGSLIGLVRQYALFLRNLSGRGARPGQWYSAVLDLVALTAAAGLYFIVPVAVGISPLVTSIPMIAMFPLVFSFRALSDHYGIPPMESREQMRREVVDTDDRWRPALRRVSAWVVRTHPFLEWLWSHVNYHEVHHKFPYLPHSQLKDAFESTRDELPYLVLDGYTQAIRVLREYPYYNDPREVMRFSTLPGKPRQAGADSAGA